MAKTPTPSNGYTLYPGKSVRVQGTLSKDGGAIFERIRAGLLKTTKRKRISDADVIDFAVRVTNEGGINTIIERMKIA